jgi:hypothetical protein
MVYGPHDDQLREGPILRRALGGRTQIPVGEGTLLWTRAHVDDVASAVLAAIDQRTADGRAVSIGEERVLPITAWCRQILDPAKADTELVRVPDSVVPGDLSLSKAHPQHLLASVHLAHELLGWQSGDPAIRVQESVQWHITHSDLAALSDAEASDDDDAFTLWPRAAAPFRKFSTWALSRQHGTASTRRRHVSSQHHTSSPMRRAAIGIRIGALSGVISAVVPATAAVKSSTGHPLMGGYPEPAHDVS